MHGYEANLELERRCIRDWAAISRPQVYYSLEKLAAAGLIRETQSSESASGPERAVFETTPRGRAATAAGRCPVTVSGPALRRRARCRRRRRA